MRRQAKASPTRSPMTNGRRSFGLTCLCLLALAAIVGPGTATAAETCPNAKYRTGPSLFLPECRVYEMVTPPSKAQYLRVLIGTTNPIQVSEDGERVLYLTASGPLDEDPSWGINTWERAQRSADGWNIESAVPPIVSPITELGNGFPRWVVPSSNLGKILFTASAVYDPGQAFNGKTNFNGGVFLSDGKAETWVSKPTWAGALPAQGESNALWATFVPVGGSSDLGISYFISKGTLTPADGTSGRGPMESWAVYKYENGQLSNAGTLPDGSISPGGSVSADRATAPGPGLANQVHPADTDAPLDHPVSRDGRSLLFVSPEPLRAAADPTLPAPQLYMAIDGRPSVLISAPKGEADPISGTAGVVPTSYRAAVGTPPTSGFAVATPDHSVVLFSTKDALTADAAAVDPETIKTYRYETASGDLTYLPDLDRTGTGKVGYVVELSESGNSMLYVTASGSLRLWRKGQPTMTVSEGVQAVNQGNGTYITRAVFSADESVIALNSTGPLRGNPDHTPGAGASSYRSQVYRYTVADNGLECISCQPGGTPNGAVLSMWGPANGYSPIAGTQSLFWATRPMTADGSTIYFTTKSALLPEDHNTVDDAYQWHDGHLRLITTGASGADPEQFYTTTPSGRDVFIISRSRLAPSDKDEMFDIYDARAGGGIEEAEPPKPCAGDECQGPPAPPPAASSPASAAINGKGNTTASRVTLRASAPKRAVGTAAKVRVRVSEAGRVVATGALVRRVARSVSKAGSYGIRVALTGAGKRKLRQTSVVNAAVRVEFRAGSGRTATRTIRVKFKQPASSHPTSKRKGR